MPRTFKHFDVAFQRQVTQRQTVDVAVAPELDAQTQRTVAYQLAAKRLRDSAWENVKVGEPTITPAGEVAAK